MKVGFYCMGPKGYFVLKHFVEKYGDECLVFVVSDRDKNMRQDCFDEIASLIPREKFYERTKFKDHEKDLDKPDITFAISWRWMLPKSEELIVLHDSLLPRYRGFAPLVNALVNGEKEIGVTAFKAADEYDKGPILLQKSTKIEYPIKISEAIEIIERIYWELVDEIMTKIINKEDLKEFEQDESKATYSPWLDDFDYYIDWTWDSSKIRRFVDATGFPYDCAKTLAGNKVLKVIEVEEVEDVVVIERERHVGKVIFMVENKPTVICGKGLVRILKMTDENGKEVKINFRTRFIKPMKT